MFVSKTKLTCFYGFCKRVESSHKGLAPLHSNTRNEVVYKINIMK